MYIRVLHQICVRNRTLCDGDNSVPVFHTPHIFLCLLGESFLVQWLCLTVCALCIFRSFFCFYHKPFVSLFSFVVSHILFDIPYTKTTGHHTLLCFDKSLSFLFLVYTSHIVSWIHLSTVHNPCVNLVDTSPKVVDTSLVDSS